MPLIRQILSRTITFAAIAIVVWAFARVVVRDVIGRSGDADGTIVLRVMHWSGGGGQEEDAIVADAIANFEAAHPGIRVERLNPGDSGQFLTKLQTMMAAGEPPDVFYMDYKRLPSFVDADQLADIGAWLERDPGELSLEDFYDAPVDAFRWDGREFGAGPLWGLPKDFTTLGFYYNRTLFDRAGVAEPDPDWTWDDFLSAARTIGELEDATGAVFVTWPFVLRGYLWTQGARVRGETWDDVPADDPTLLAALDQLRAWRHDEENTLAPAEAAGISPDSRFLTGRYGMVGPLGRWVVPTFRKIKAPADGGFEWDFAPIPRGTERANVVATVAWSMSSRSKHPEESWALLRYLVGREAQDRQSRLGLAIPTLRSVAESDAFIDSSLAPSRDRDYLDAAEIARVPAWPADPRFEDMFRRKSDAILKQDSAPGPVWADFADWWRELRSSPLTGRDFPAMPWGLIGGSIAALLGIIGAAVMLRLRATRPPGLAARANERAGWTMISPWIIGFTVFMAFPIGLSLLLSFAQWNGIGPLDTARFVGLANYAQALGRDSTFHKSIMVTLYYAIVAVPLGQAFAIIAALLLNTTVRGVELFRAAWYLPSVLAGVGISILFQWVFKADGGLLNAVLEPLLAPIGLSPPGWFMQDAAWAGPPAFAIMNLWLVGGSMMIYLAGLRNIPRELYEAADIDRVGPVTRFFRITIPMLGPVILFNGIMAIIASFQVFVQAYVMTGGGPDNHTLVYVLYLYNLAFDFYRMGYASALAWILLAIVLVLTVVVLKTSSRFVYYEGLRS